VASNKQLNSGTFEFHENSSISFRDQKVASNKQLNSSTSKFHENSSRSFRDETQGQT
jgi:hypothetical protein